MIQVKRILLCIDLYIQPHSPWLSGRNWPVPPSHPAHLPTLLTAKEALWPGRAQLAFPVLQEEGATHVLWPRYSFVCLLQTPRAVFRVFVEMVGNLCCCSICKSPCKPVSPSALEVT